MMVTNGILMLLGGVVLVVALRAFRKLDGFPDECRLGIQKDIGLIIVWSLGYIGFEWRWIMNEYSSAIRSLDEYGWSALEVLGIVIFLRMMRRLQIGRAYDLVKKERNNAGICKD